MELVKQHCIPCSADTKLLELQEAEEMLKEIPDWYILNEDPLLLHRFFKFKSYGDTTNFIKQIIEISTEEEHYADITFGNKYAIVTLHTQTIKGLHNNDFIIAAKISSLGF
jgi:4a-hydroxytetrahydrobiopterin dehydratase